MNAFISYRLLANRLDARGRHRLSYRKIACRVGRFGTKAFFFVYVFLAGWKA